LTEALTPASASVDITVKHVVPIGSVSNSVHAAVVGAKMGGLSFVSETVTVRELVVLSGTNPSSVATIWRV
jgi:hypothetical protein